MSELTDEQKCLLVAEGKVVLTACPGSGKTFIVAKKMQQYVESWQHPYRGIAVLSFTNVAKDEILHTAIENSKIVTSQLGYPHFVGTLDSFIDNFIFLRFGHLMYKDNPIRPRVLLENSGAFPYGNRDCYRCDINDFHWSQNCLLKSGEKLSCNILNKPCLAMKKAMIKKGLATQREVPALTVSIMNKYNNIASLLAYRFPVIIVDEAQDTSKEQMEILEIIATAGVETMILVGDSDQAIYEWRDATPEYFISKIIDSAWSHLQLTTNFRSTQAICDATSAFSSILSTDKTTKAFGQSSQLTRKPILLQFEKDKAKSDVINKFKSLCLDSGISYDAKSVAILTRARIHSNTDITKLWQTSETKLLASATYQWHCNSKHRAYNLCEQALYNIFWGNAHEMTQEEIRMFIEKNVGDRLWRKQVILLLSGLPEASVALSAWKTLMMSTLDFVITNIVNTINIKPKPVSELVKLKTKVKNKNDKNFSTEFLSKPLQEFFEKRVSKEVTVSSVHGVKGESFDAVLLLIMSNREKLNASVLSKGSLDREELRIAYVAMTRPRKLLVVAIPKQKEKELPRFPHIYWEYQIV